MYRMFVSFPNAYVEIPAPDMILGSVAFAGKLGHEAGALTSGISALIKGPQRALSLSFFLCEDTMRIWHSATQKRALTRTQSCWQPDFRLQNSTTIRHNFYCL